MTTAQTAAGGPPLSINISTRIYVIILGVLAGVGGLLHGVFEMFQGSVPPTDRLPRIGAFTMVPNYLVTGICASLIGTCLVLWTTTTIQKKWGPTVFLALSMLLALVGGGVALIPGTILAWAVATRIRKPLSWWKKVLPVTTRKILSDLWLVVLLVGLGLFMIGFGIWSLVLPPGEVRQPTM